MQGQLGQHQVKTQHLLFFFPFLFFYLFLILFFFSYLLTLLENKKKKSLGKSVPNLHMADLCPQQLKLGSETLGHNLDVFWSPTALGSIS